jgi:hypothetical protein
MNKRPDFFEPYPKMPERLVYKLDVIVYENGIEYQLFDDSHLEDIKDEIEKLFSDRHFAVAYEDVANGETALSVGYLDDDGNEQPIPREWMKKKIVFGHPKTEKELRLVGDRLPIIIRGHPSMEVRFMDE